jgi:hypothetical protein
MERIYDLNGREKCVTAIIKVSDMEFRISRVVTGVRVEYSNLLVGMGSMMKEVGHFDVSAASDDEVREMSAKAERFAKGKADTYRRCMRLLLEKNGIPYDPAWWDENADEYDIRNFIEACLSKDSQSVKKK